MDDWGLSKYEPHNQSKWECAIIMRIVLKFLPKCASLIGLLFSQNYDVEGYLMMFDTLI
jgi:hypothetical protein